MHLITAKILISVENKWLIWVLHYRISIYTNL